MPITEILQKNADFYPNDVSLVEINPKLEKQSPMTWREYSLIETNPREAYRKEITWSEFNKQANRFANGGELFALRVRGVEQDGLYRVYNHKNEFIGLGELSEDKELLLVKRVYLHD